MKTKVRADDLSGDLFKQPPAAPPPVQGGEPPPRAPEGPSLSEFASRAYLARVLWVQGYPDQAASLVERSLSDAMHI